MKITYIGHSGFLLEVSEAYFLFDYYEGEIPKMNPEYPIVVFVSHKHADHYNPKIFELVKKYPRIHYVLSRDVPTKRKMEEYAQQGIDLGERITVARKNTVYELTLFGSDVTDGKKLKITTLRSTDLGVAYLLEYEGKKYYHAGDLNLWLWAGESKQFNDNMRTKYFRELDKMKGLEIEAAFVPLDARQEKDAFAGMESFLEYTKTRMVFPMHFWGKYEIISEFLNKHPECRQRVALIERKGQNFELPGADFAVPGI